MARTINLGADATDADYQIRDSSATGGDFIIEHLPTGATFEYDATNNRWKPTDPIDLNTNDLEDGATTVYDASTDTVGDGTNTSADHTSVSTDQANITEVAGRAELTGSAQSINDSSVTQLSLDNQDIEDGDILTVDLANDKITITADGTYLCTASCEWAGSSGWASGDHIQIEVKDDTNNDIRDRDQKPHEGSNQAFGLKAVGVVTVSGNTDIIGQVYHEAGQSEDIQAIARGTHLEVVRIG